MIELLGLPVEQKNNLDSFESQSEWINGGERQEWIDEQKRKENGKVKLKSQEQYSWKTFLIVIESQLELIVAKSIKSCRSTEYKKPSKQMLYVLKQVNQGIDSASVEEFWRGRWQRETLQLKKSVKI